MATAITKTAKTARWSRNAKENVTCTYRKNEATLKPEKDFLLPSGVSTNATITTQNSSRALLKEVDETARRAIQIIPSRNSDFSFVPHFFRPTNRSILQPRKRI